MLCLVLLVSCATAADFQQCIEPSYSDAKVSYLGPEGTYTTGTETYITTTGLGTGDTINTITITGKQTDAGVYEGEIAPSAIGVFLISFKRFAETWETNISAISASA